LEKHVEYTGSPVADYLRKDFDNQSKHFAKVFPKEYKKALEKNRKSIEVSVG
jgi:glutamate synthase (NADPH) large chain